jgi:hypothetical protein
MKYLEDAAKRLLEPEKRAHFQQSYRRFQNIVRLASTEVPPTSSTAVRSSG